MDKRELIKIIIFFTVSFIIILAGMTVSIGFFRPDPSAAVVAVADSLGEDSLSAIPPDTLADDSAGDSGADSGDVATLDTAKTDALDSSVTIIRDSARKVAAPPQKVKKEAAAVVDQKTKIKLDSLSTLVDSYAAKTKSLKDQIQRNAEAKDEAAELEKNAKKIAKIYSQMPAEDAAILISGLDAGMAAHIISGMKQRNAAKILAAMDKNQALTISKKIAKGN